MRMIFKESDCHMCSDACLLLPGVEQCHKDLPNRSKESLLLSFVILPLLPLHALHGALMPHCILVSLLLSVMSFGS